MSIQVVKLALKINKKLCFRSVQILKSSDDAKKSTWIDNTSNLGQIFIVRSLGSYT